MEDHPPPHTTDQRENQPQEQPFHGPTNRHTGWTTTQPEHGQFRPAHNNTTAALAAASAAWAAADSQRGYAAAALAIGDFPAAHRAWQDAAHEQSAAAYHSATAITTQVRAEAAATRLSPTGYQPPTQPNHDHTPHQSHARHRGPTQTPGPRRTR